MLASFREVPSKMETSALNLQTRISRPYSHSFLLIDGSVPGILQVQGKVVQEDISDISQFLMLI